MLLASNATRSMRSIFISLYAICNESITVPSGGGREKTIHGGSQLGVVFKAIIYRSLCLKARPSDVDAYALQDESSDQMAHIADDDEDMTPAEIRTHIEDMASAAAQLKEFIDSTQFWKYNSQLQALLPR